MTPDTKPCEVCPNLIVRDYDDSAAKWERRRACSRQCGGKLRGPIKRRNQDIRPIPARFRCHSCGQIHGGDHRCEIRVPVLLGETL